MTSYHDHNRPHEHDHPVWGSRTLSRRALLKVGAAGFGAVLLGSCREGDSNSGGAGNRTNAPGTPDPGAGTVGAGGVATPATRLSKLPGFDQFAPRVKVSTDGRSWVVESDGMPAHNMMVGIRSWQQQVPLPQPYSGSNAWTFPTKGTLADKPISAKTALYRGAIALAANGVPIFNALNNRGDDAYLAGELDNWGGHSGRADDYHYHVAPLHLQSVIGTATPIGYGLDGFPLYGLTEPDGRTAVGLDEFNGHMDAAGDYHYHSTLTFPYVNGGMRGVVQVRDDQVDPQPAATPVRPALQPLSGATITGFKTLSAGSYSLEYQVAGQTYTLNYGFQGNMYTFEFVDPAGGRRAETYTRH